jgi:glucosamine-6-phosphate deaminase
MVGLIPLFAVKTLEPETREEYARMLGGVPVPPFAITLGIGTIMEARQLLLLAWGGHKAEVVQKMVEGPITSEVPASVLQLHPRVRILLDEASASKLKRRDYYRWVSENKWRVGQRR